MAGGCSTLNGTSSLFGATPGASGYSKFDLALAQRHLRLVADQKG